LAYTLRLSSDYGHTAEGNSVGISVCSRYSLSGFGERQAGGHGRNVAEADYGTSYRDHSEFLSQLRKAIDTEKETFFKMAFVEAIVTSRQPKACKNLRELGFAEHFIPQYVKYPWGISVFTISVKDLCQVLGISKRWKSAMKAAEAIVPSDFPETDDADATDTDDT
jgi:hypothetical protein